MLLLLTCPVSILNTTDLLSLKHTGTPCFTALCRYCIFTNWRSMAALCWAHLSAWLFQQDFAHLASLCHILVILAVFQTCSLLYLLWWCYLWCILFINFDIFQWNWLAGSRTPYPHSLCALLPLSIPLREVLWEAKTSSTGLFALFPGTVQFLGQDFKQAGDWLEGLGPVSAKWGPPQGGELLRTWRLQSGGRGTGSCWQGFPSAKNGPHLDIWKPPSHRGDGGDTLRAAVSRSCFWPWHILAFWA